MFVVCVLFGVECEYWIVYHSNFEYWKWEISISWGCYSFIVKHLKLHLIDTNTLMMQMHFGCLEHEHDRQLLIGEYSTYWSWICDWWDALVRRAWKLPSFLIEHNILMNQLSGLCFNFETPLDTSSTWGTSVNLTRVWKWLISCAESPSCISTWSVSSTSNKVLRYILSIGHSQLTLSQSVKI